MQRNKLAVKAFKVTRSVSKVVIYAWYVKNLAQFFKQLLSAGSLDAALSTPKLPDCFGGWSAPPPTPTHICIFNSIMTHRKKGRQIFLAEREN